MAKKQIKATASAYSGISDEEFLGYDTSARASWDKVAGKQSDADRQKAFIKAGTGLTDDMLAALVEQYNAGAWLPASDLHNMLLVYTGLENDVRSLQGEAQALETKRENRGAVLGQGGENVRAAGAGAAAVANENLLARNIGQEITGRISRNNQQAAEALTGIGLVDEATLGRQRARAGAAGYDVASGTAGAMAEASRAKSDADRAAIEGYRVGRQNLLMGQGEAATKAAESLTGTIGKQTKDWETLSTAAIGDVTGNLLTNVNQARNTPGFAGDVNTPGVEASRAAVGTTLDTWSFKSYTDVLDTLTSRSANKATWDQMLLDQAGTPTNPYGQFDAAISPLTPVAGTSSNLLAAAAGSDNLDNVYTLSGSRNKTGRLI